jgi:hypothetical protein
MFLGNFGLVGVGVAGAARVMSSPKMNPALMNAPTLPPPSYQPTSTPVEEEIPEIVVSAKRIPWYAWVGIGAVGFLVLDGLIRR